MTAKNVNQTADASSESFSSEVLKTVTRPARLVSYPGAVELPRDSKPDDELPQSFEWYTTALELDEIYHASGRLTALQGDTEGVPLQFLDALRDQNANLLVDIVKVTVRDEGKRLSVTLRERPGNALGVEDA